MLPNNEREVVHFNFALRTEPPSKYSSLREIAEMLVDEVSKTRCTQKIESETILIAISDAQFVDIDGEKDAGLALLFNVADPNASVATNYDMTSHATRDFDFENDEGRGKSAHLLLRLDPTTPGTPNFNALLERAIGLGQSRVRPHLQRVISKLFKEHGWVVEDDNGDEKRLHPKVAMEAVRRDRFSDEDKVSEIAELVFIDAQIPESDFDAPEFAKVTKREMRVKVDQPIGMSVSETISALNPLAKENGFHQVFVSWKRRKGSETEDMPASARNRATIELENADFGEALFAKRHFVTLDEAMSDCVTRLSQDMIDKMAALI